MVVLLIAAIFQNPSWYYIELHIKLSIKYETYFQIKVIYFTFTTRTCQEDKGKEIIQIVAFFFFYQR